MTSEPLFTLETLFTAGEGAYTNYRIPGVCVTPGGDVLAHCEARRGRGGDWDDSDILARRSTDGGRSWSAASVLLRGADYGAGPVHNCCTLVDAEHGTLHVLFCAGYARAFHMVSRDDGLSFSEPVDITAAFEHFRPEYDWGVLAVGLPHGIRLRSGRLLFPVWLSISKTQAHRPNRCGVIVSDDGRSWQRGALVPEVLPNLNESCALELADGRVLLNMRNDGLVRRRVLSLSADGGDTWTTPWLDPALLERQPVREPCCATAARRRGAAACCSATRPIRTAWSARGRRGCSARAETSVCGSVTMSAAAGRSRAPSSRAIPATARSPSAPTALCFVSSNVAGPTVRIRMISWRWRASTLPG